MQASRRAFLLASAALSLSLAATSIAGAAISLSGSPPLTLDEAIAEIGPDGMANLIRSKMSWHDDGCGAMWAGRVTAVMTSGMRAAYARGRPGISDLRKAVTLEGFIDASRAGDLHPSVLKGVRSALSSLPGYDPSRGYRQSRVTMDQHGYLQLYMVGMLDMLEKGGDAIADDVLSGQVDWDRLRQLEA